MSRLTIQESAAGRAGNFSWTWNVHPPSGSFFWATGKEYYVHKLGICAIVAAAFLAACHGGTVVPSAGGQTDQSGASTADAPRLAANAIPQEYQCFPSTAAHSPSRGSEKPSIAYAGNCAVDKARESAHLQEMAISLMGSSAGGPYSSYCTGTPISYDASTGIGFVVTAAHCVVGETKAANAEITPRNITTFAGNDDRAAVFQGTPARDVSADRLTGGINAVYVPSKYCYVPAITRAGGCTDLAAQDGDVAVLKIQAAAGQKMDVMALLRLAPASLTMPSGAYVMALGYGLNNGASPESSVLYYIDYQYFANDSYAGSMSEASLMNGYLVNSTYYSIICSGDSGGPDLYWDGQYWELVGAHSFGPNPCGNFGAKYDAHNDVSADTRQFTEWIDRIVKEDKSATGCRDINPNYVCAARP
jgi:V8-like Glu-specific endopeptidase